MNVQVMLKFWKYKLWKWQEIMNHQETWYDGISYFDVGADGKIFQHVADKVLINYYSNSANYILSLNLK